MTNDLVFSESWDEYWTSRNDPVVWLPFVRRAYQAAEMPCPEPITMLVPSQYPTARVGETVVTIYPEWISPGAYDLEREAHQLVENRGLPIPHLLAHGDVRRTSREPPWSWLIESTATGQPWSVLADELDPTSARYAAQHLGAELRRLHDTPHDHSRIYGTGWARFAELIEDELTHLGVHDDRLAMFPPDSRSALRDLAASTCRELDTTRPTRLLHGDLHPDNVFFDPTTAELTAIIDLNETYAGDPWYDLADACFRLFRGEPGLTEYLLRGYGFNPDTDGRIALRLLGWGLLHDFDGLTSVVRSRGRSATDIRTLAARLTGLSPD